MGADRWSKGLAALAPVHRQDDWKNVFTGVGGITDKRVWSEFTAEIVTVEEAVELWRANDLAARIVETLPNEMLREGFELRIKEDTASEEADDEDESVTNGQAAKPDKTKAFQADALPFNGEPGEGVEPGTTEPGVPASQAPKIKAHSDAKMLQEAVSSKWEDIGLVAALHEALCYERAYGGAAILLGVNDGQAPTKPLNLDRVISFDWLTALEPREIMPIAWYADPQAAKFGLPALYQLTPIAPGPGVGAQTYSTATIQVHESRLLVFGGIRVSRRALSGTNGWGDSVLTRVNRVLRDFDISWASTGVLLHDFAQAVIKVKGLYDIAAEGNFTELKKRIEAIEYSRSIVGAVIIDADEEFERKQTPVTGLPELLTKMESRLAAAADMPLTLLMGQSPGGMNATGESDIRFFYDRVGGAQERKLTPAIERVVELIFRVMKVPEPKSWSISYRPLWQPSEKEAADARYVQAQTDEKYIVNSVLSAEEVARARFGGDEYNFNTTVDFAEREAMRPIAPPPAKTAQQMETEAADHDLKVKALEAKTGGSPFGNE